MKASLFSCSLVRLILVAAALLLVGSPLGHAQTLTAPTIVDYGTGGDTGNYSSQLPVNGLPAVAYSNGLDQRLMFARNSAANGTGAWAITVVDDTFGVGFDASLAIINGNPAISYHAANGDLFFAANSNINGTGTWTISRVLTGSQKLTTTSLANIAGYPTIAYYDAGAATLSLVRNSAVDGSGTWTTSVIDYSNNPGTFASLALIGSKPAVAYYVKGSGDLRYARNSAADGTGLWTFTSVDLPGDVGQYPSLIFNGTAPMISYYDATNTHLKLARNSAADGSGSWSTVTVDAASGVGTLASIGLVNGNVAVAYLDVPNYRIKLVRNSNAAGTGSWTVVSTYSLGAQQSVNPALSLSIAGGNPAVTYYKYSPDNFRGGIYNRGTLAFLRNSAVDGSGAWTATIADAGFRSGAPGLGGVSQRVYGGALCLAYNDLAAQRFARNTDPAGSGHWTTTTISTLPGYSASFVPQGDVPSLFYNFMDGSSIQYLRAPSADGSGTWTETTAAAFDVLNGISPHGVSVTATTVGGRPAALYLDYSGNLNLVQNSVADGSGSWNVSSLGSGTGLGAYGIVNDGLVRIFVDGSGVLTFSRNPAADGSGTAVLTTVESSVTLSTSVALAIVAGNPALAFSDGRGLKFARNSAANGSGVWTVTAVDTTLASLTGPPQLTTIRGTPAILYPDATGQLRYAQASAADGSGAWNTSLVIRPAGSFGLSTTSLYATDAYNGSVAYQTTGGLDLASQQVLYPADIALEQPAGTDHPNNSAQVITSPIGSNTSLVYTIRNVGGPDLTGLGITIDGPNAADFSVPVPPVAPVSGPSGSTTFTLRFAPTVGGTKTAALHIASNDPDENPFTINLTGNALSSANDTDGDGLNDVAEYNLAALGFNWQVSQPALVQTLFNNAGSAGLYTTAQVQGMNVNTPLLARDGSTGQFTLTMGLEQSTDLKTYSSFSFAAGGLTVNSQGKLEFRFSLPGNAAFLRVKAQ